jgi:metallo-beta-lactamase family protein
VFNAGRFLHHLARNISKPETYAVIAEFQSYSSPRRKLGEGQYAVEIFGSKHKVSAKVRTLYGFIAHSVRSDLLNWFSSLAPSKSMTIVTHGEEEQRKTP